jgi:BlaI family transcriptional regulator, penicillinase repressor
MRKSRNHVLSLPPLELACMKVLWTLGQANVHGIRAGMLSSRPLAYTTVMTIMGRLARKGVVERRKQGRFHLYRPLVSDMAVREHAVGRLVDDFFRGSRESLREYLESGANQIAAGAEPARALAATADLHEQSHEHQITDLAVEDGIDPSLL